VRLVIVIVWNDGFVLSPLGSVSVYLKGWCGDRPASSLVVSLGKDLNGITSTFEWLDW